jgi:hypothetical protein
MQYPNDKLLPVEVAKILGKATSTLARERSTGGGCPYLRINGKVFYLRADVEAHAAKNVTLILPVEVV